MPPETAPAYLVSYTDVVCEGVEQAPSRSVRRPPLHVRPPRRRQTSPHSSKFYPRETGQRETRYVPPVFCDVHSRMASTRLNTRPSSQCTPCQSQSSMTRTLTSTQWVSVSAFPVYWLNPDYAFASLRPQAELCQIGSARWRFERLTEPASFRDRAFKA